MAVEEDSWRHSGVVHSNSRLQSFQEVNRFKPNLVYNIILKVIISTDSKVLVPLSFEKYLV